MPRKTYTERMHDHNGLPKVEEVTDPRLAARYGGPKLLVASPPMYSDIMARVPEGKVITVPHMRAYLAQKAQADCTCPLTAGIFVNICAHASVEPGSNRIPYWRTLKAGGGLNEKYPGGLQEQKLRLEKEGHQILKRGQNLWVKSYEDSLWDIAE